MNSEKPVPVPEIRLDEDGIPILEEVLETAPGTSGDDGQAKKTGPMDESLEQTIEKLARSVAAEAAVEFAREMEIRLIKSLAPLLEARWKKLYTEAQSRDAIAPDQQEQASGVSEEELESESERESSETPDAAGAEPIQDPVEEQRSEMQGDTPPEEKRSSVLESIARITPTRDG